MDARHAASQPLIRREGSTKEQTVAERQLAEQLENEAARKRQLATTLFDTELLRAEAERLAAKKKVDQFVSPAKPAPDADPHEEQIQIKVQEIKNNIKMRLTLVVLRDTIRDEVSKEPGFHKLSPEAQEDFITYYQNKIDPDNEMLSYDDYKKR
ncbi:MAG: hypothetical protein K8S99_12975 [Planctomycetes bacterium]|nr:hypothetical protein [Planctomycetota bacterium]